MSTRRVKKHNKYLRPTRRNSLGGVCPVYRPEEPPPSRGQCLSRTTPIDDGAVNPELFAEPLEPQDDGRCVMPKEIVLPDDVTSVELAIGKTRVKWPSWDGENKWDVWGPQALHGAHLLTTHDTMVEALTWARGYEATRVKLAAEGLPLGKKIDKKIYSP